MTKTKANPTDEQGLGASLRDRAATPSEPSQSSVVSGKAGIPSAAQVADALRWLGGRTSAVALCAILEIRGFDRANAQLGMQRAFDCDEPTVRVNDDWTLSAIAIEAQRAETVQQGSVRSTKARAGTASPERRSSPSIDEELIELARARDDEMCVDLADRLESLLSDRAKLEDQLHAAFMAGWLTGHHGNEPVDAWPVYLDALNRSTDR